MRMPGQISQCLDRRNRAYCKSERQCFKQLDECSACGKETTYDNRPASWRSFAPLADGSLTKLVMVVTNWPKIRFWRAMPAPDAIAATIEMARIIRSRRPV